MKTSGEKQEILKQGIDSDFWAIICEYIRNGIEELEIEAGSDELFKLSAEQYKFVHQVIQAKKAYLKKLQELPDQLIISLNDFDSGEKDYDPYFVGKDFEK